MKKKNRESARISLASQSQVLRIRKSFGLARRFATLLRSSLRESLAPRIAFFNAARLPARSRAGGVAIASPSALLHSPLRGSLSQARLKILDGASRAPPEIGRHRIGNESIKRRRNSLFHIGGARTRRPAFLAAFAIATPPARLRAGRRAALKNAIRGASDSRREEWSKVAKRRARPKDLRIRRTCESEASEIRADSRYSNFILPRLPYNNTPKFKIHPLSHSQFPDCGNCSDAKTRKNSGKSSGRFLCCRFFSGVDNTTVCR